MKLQYACLFKRIGIIGFCMTLIMGVADFSHGTQLTIVEKTRLTPSTQPNPSMDLSEDREDYFISIDTVIIGCTAGAAAGILVGSIPLAGAMATGIGIPESVNLLGNLTGMGCGVGAASSGVGILTAWFLNHIKGILVERENTGPANGIPKQ